MLGSIISAVLGGGGGLLGGNLLGSLTGLGAEGGMGNIVSAVSGLVGGGAIGGLMGRGSDAAAAGDAAASGSINPKQIIGGLLGGAGAGAIGNGVVGMLTSGRINRPYQKKKNAAMPRFFLSTIIKPLNSYTRTTHFIESAGPYEVYDTDQHCFTRQLAPGLNYPRNI